MSTEMTRRDAQHDYWTECIECAFESAGINASIEQVTDVAAAVRVSHECYGMAFYSPPASDRLNAIEDEWRKKYADLEREFNRYRGGAETAIKRALRQFPDTRVSIRPNGDVYRHGGRTEQIG